MCPSNPRYPWSRNRRRVTPTSDCSREHLCGNPIPSSKPAAQSDSRGRSWAPTGVSPAPLPLPTPAPCFPPFPTEGNTLSAP
ncbi:hypothetical protein ALC57_01366 [Trachymyrmex cornetzi]|uniref:Uncharacterized protein n=1 Tax=Trachymyrmex cornetzi TaxID=471704 RepID=A0A195EM01_9HYME|nr:hypothetical protein ALC57_01366 [Trachymyrmex cornetzi]